MSDLTDFLLARIAEDEAGASGQYEFDRPHWSRCNYFGPDHMGGGDCDCNYAARVLAECEAKRRLVRWCGQWGEPAFREPLAFLALPYADHPDYREEWANG